MVLATWQSVLASSSLLPQIKTMACYRFGCIFYSFSLIQVFFVWTKVKAWIQANQQSDYSTGHQHEPEVQSWVYDALLQLGNCVQESDWSVSSQLLPDAICFFCVAFPYVWSFEEIDLQYLVWMAIDMVVQDLCCCVSNWADKGLQGRLVLRWLVNLWRRRYVKWFVFTHSLVLKTVR